MPIDPDVARSTTYPDRQDGWDADRVILYHLGLGIGADPDELDYVYERRLKVLPAFAVIPGFEAVRPALQGPGLDYQLSKLLHGEQEVVFHAPLPPEATVVSTPQVEAVYDKGKAALVVLRTDTRTTDGTDLFTARYSLFIRGEGGFGGDPSPRPEPWEPQGEPFAVVEQQTLPQQALIYRLSGDRNPLHADPGFAAKAGFDRPILHGLCTYGMVCKAVVDCALDGDPTGLAGFSARFAGTVYPGETLQTKVWRDGDRILVEATVMERSVVALANGVGRAR